MEVLSNSENVRGSLNVHRVENVSFTKSHCGVRMKIHVLDANVIRHDNGSTEFMDGVEHEFEITLFSLKGHGKHRSMPDDVASDDLAERIIEAANSLRGK